MTDEMMVAHLRAQGWHVRPPADLRTPGPWIRQQQTTMAGLLGEDGERTVGLGVVWVRLWVGSEGAMPAAYVRYWSGGWGWTWRCSLISPTRKPKRITRKGAAETAIEAKDAADEALKALMTEARDNRLRRIKLARELQGGLV